MSSVLIKTWKIKARKKSDLIDILVKHTRPTHNAPDTDVTLLDGPGLLYEVLPKGCKTFNDYQIMQRKKLFLILVDIKRNHLELMSFGSNI